MININGLLIEPLKSENFIEEIEPKKKYDIDIEVALHLSRISKKMYREIMPN